MNKPSNRLVLVGSMGAGKTTLGQLLAKQVDLPFLDTDEEIESRSGADISWIFDKEGEEGFRQREASVLRELLELPSFVMATGGGVLLNEDNRSLLKNDKFFVIYLKISLKQQLKRLALDSKRPLLQNTDRELVLKKLQEERDPLYTEVADAVLLIDSDDSKYLVSQINKTIQEKN